VRPGQKVAAGQGPMQTQGQPQMKTQAGGSREARR
jgi:hypothetical protein